MGFWRLDHITTGHGARVHIPQQVLGLVTAALDTMSHLALMPSAKDGTDVTEMCYGVVLAQECLDLVRLSDALQRLVTEQVAVTLHVGGEDVGALGVDDLLGTCQVLERVHPHGLLDAKLGTRRRNGDI